jgi:hypothetical protein
VAQLVQARPDCGPARVHGAAGRLARQRIGFEGSLCLLRCGARVMASIAINEGYLHAHIEDVVRGHRRACSCDDAFRCRLG